MAHILSEIGKKLSRIFWGRIVVSSLEGMHREASITIMTHFHGVKISPMRTEPRVQSALFFKWKTTKAASAGNLLGGQLLKKFKVHSVSLPIVKKKSVYRCKLNLKARVAVKRAMKKITRMPITSRNRLSFVKSLPKFEKASVLALYSPIFEGKVIKSALDKASGNLLFWYDNDRPKAGERHHLLLLRVFGGNEPLKWIWLPANKKIS
jgi:hypothetical protein